MFRMVEPHPIRWGQVESGRIRARRAYGWRALRRAWWNDRSGESNQQIGRELALSTNTVSNHIASILAKLHLDNRIQAAVQAVRAGIS
jgi:hypothetical protein